MDKLKKTSGLSRFLLTLLAVWVLAWLPLGILKGHLTYVLSAASRNSLEREIYQGLLYTGLFIAFISAWTRNPPSRPSLGKPLELLKWGVPIFFSALLARGLLTALGASNWPQFSLEPIRVAQALGLTLVVALIEEAIFRGWLLGQLLERYSEKSAIVASAAAFASVHLFRPGSLLFKLALFIGLFLLGLVLARVALSNNALTASAGVHGGLILPNLWTPPLELANNWWAGWNSEPASGALGWLFLLSLWGSCEVLSRAKLNPP